MQMKIQLAASELAEILAGQLDHQIVQCTVNPQNIDRITASCQPDGALDSLSVSLSFEDANESHYESDNDNEE